MRLQISNGKDVINPSESQLAEALSGLPGGSESFAILMSGAETYIQVAGSAEEGFILEYRDGAEENHFEAVGNISLEVVTDIFQKYVVSDIAWKNIVAWQPWGAGTDIKPAMNKIPLYIGFLVFLVCVFYFVYFT